MAAPLTLTVPVRARIPASTRIRIAAGRVTARLGAVGLTETVMRRLAFDVKVGTGTWQRRWVVTTFHEEETP